MSTLLGLNKKDIGTNTPLMYSKIRTILETAFYRNNVINVGTLKEAYNLAKNSPGTVVTDLPIYKTEEIGLEEDSKVLIFNDGDRTGRTAAARKILGDRGVDENEYAGKLREAVFSSRKKKMYRASVCVGLHEDFMVRAHLLIPEGYENVLYSWMLNFQDFNDEIKVKYDNSETIEEGDIFVYSDPDWSHEDHPVGLTFFDSDHNCAALLGMRYFGEHKKGTLTLAWTIATRCGYTPCHGGQKRYNLPNGDKFVAGVFGLSGSGKSTITHAKHKEKYDVTVLHDDAFIISNDDGSSISMEPSYFDKTQDYPTDSPDNKYLLTMQNCAATMDDQGKIVPVTEDIRNGNGRAIKSKYWSPNRAYKFEKKCDAIFWLMKDESMPPVMKVNSSTLAATLGATLATKRSSAEHLLKGVDSNKLVIEPYANPFRTYPLCNDYKKFKSLFKEREIECYILNTGFFLHRKITPEITLGIIESIIEKKGGFKKFGPVDNIEYMEIEGYNPNFDDVNYINLVQSRIQTRLDFIGELREFNRLPYEASESLYKILEKLESIKNEI
ncbi:phosphoenolpyruvate carboxykinase (ATP) [uncultured Ilyobacter sp.]|uniref:phosphoenolpyruvate carboxykinase (ATP) n=1 Tax=uncultured Ilyobacter sp. TaxID=544433 RepID=UPI002AA87702|nr:phosphoenolpyruvate carboxykinase (ATP) [uncultured Ilyobacter sp.]